MVDGLKSVDDFKADVASGCLELANTKVQMLKHFFLRQFPAALLVRTLGHIKRAISYVFLKLILSQVLFLAVGKRTLKPNKLEYLACPPVQVVEPHGVLVEAVRASLTYQMLV